jgi:molecular chaperone DnaJ
MLAVKSIQGLGPQKMRSYSHYELLGVRRDAPLPEIRKAFRDKVKIYHPDRTPGIEGTRFQAIVEAWDILSDPVKRRLYDRQLREAAGEDDPFLRGN